MDVKMCRICLAQDVKLFDICEHNLKTPYERLTNHMVASDGLPHTLCWECSARLRSCAVFRDKALRSQALLSAMAPFDKQDISKKLQSIDRQKHKLMSSLSVSALLAHFNIKRDIWSDTNNADSSIEQVYIKQERDSPSEESETVEYNLYEVEVKCEAYYPDMLNVRIGQPQEPENPASTSVKTNKRQTDTNEKPVAEKVAKISPIEKNLQAPKTAEQKVDAYNESTIQPISNEPNVPVKKTNDEPKTVIMCDQCKQNFNSKTDLVKHLCTHFLDITKTEGEKYKISFATNTELAKHLYTHTVKTPTDKNTCRSCNTKFETNVCLMEHMERQHKVKFFGCTECEYRTSSEGCLVDHRKNHVRERMNKGVSFRCDYSSNKIINLREKSFKCKYCNYACSQKIKLSIHERIHTGEKPYKCYICDYKAARTDTLKTHMLNEHAGEKPFKCSYCNYASGKKSHLSIHERRHSGEKPYKCDICDYKAARSNSLKIHVMSKHAGEKPFKCSYCTCAFSQKCDLSRHTRKHTGEKPFKCHICDYQAAQSIHLKAHVMSKHAGEKPYKCSHCNYSSSEKSNLSKHMQKHIGAKPFQCEICDYKAGYKRSLKRHFLRIHAGVKP